ncbi:hypothetical protein ACWF95_37980 [Streptomyces vinaceus]
MNKIEMFKKSAKRRISRTATATSAATVILALGISVSTPAAADSAPASGEGGGSSTPADGKDLGRVVTQAEITNVMKGLAPLPDIALVKGLISQFEDTKEHPSADTVRKYISDQDVVNAFMYKMGDDFPYPMTPKFVPIFSPHGYFSEYSFNCMIHPDRCAFIGKLKPEGQYPAIVRSMNTYGQGGTTTDISTTTSLSKTMGTSEGFTLKGTISDILGIGLDYSITRSVSETELTSTTEARKYSVPDGKVARVEGHADSGVYIGWIAYFDPDYHEMVLAPYEQTVASPTSTSPVNYFLADYTPATAGAAPAAR